tara:strand:+ start:933 stop:2036 length:1104 start_codon:yes stop_codon:yes gene_type:complete
MIFKKNKYLEHFIALIILASCSTISKNLKLDSVELSKKANTKNFQEIYDYQSYFNNDLDTIQVAIDSLMLNQEQLKDAKILKRNYQKILSKEKYTLVLDPNNKYSIELIELIYKQNLPINIFWDEKKPSLLPENLLSQKINGFCSSLYNEAIESINKEINKSSDSTIIIYSEEYKSFIKSLELENSDFLAIKYDSNDIQAFSAEVLGVNSSESRFNKISNLNPNQNINFTPRPRSDFKQIVILLNPQEYKSMMPALRYHGGNRFKYLNFISSLEEINSPLQLMDYEDSFTPMSNFIASKIQKDASISLEKFIELGALNEWLLIQILGQAGVQSAKINGITGDIIYKANACTQRQIPLLKISSNLFSS